MLTLYKLSSSNELQWWEISHDESTIYINWGYGTEKTYTNWKNELPYTPTEYQSRINYQIDRKGWTKELPTTQPDLPMLAQVYNPDKFRDLSEIYIQPKLDGIRGLCKSTGIKTRSNLNITSCPYIEDILSWLPPGIKLDGELYIHNTDFNTIESYIMRTTPDKRLQEVITLQVFDLVDTELTFSVRKDVLWATVKFLENKWIERLAQRDKPIPHMWWPTHFPIKIVPTELIPFPRDDIYRKTVIEERLKAAKEQSYEGVMLRNPESKYLINTRSHDLLKVKSFLDDEYEVVGVEEGHGSTAVMVCKTANQIVFRCNLKASKETKRRILHNKTKQAGKWLKVEHEGIQINGKPRCPVGIHLFERKPHE